MEEGPSYVHYVCGCLFLQTLSILVVCGCSSSFLGGNFFTDFHMERLSLTNSIDLSGGTFEALLMIGGKICKKHHCNMHVCVYHCLAAVGQFEVKNCEVFFPLFPSTPCFPFLSSCPFVCCFIGMWSFERTLHKLTLALCLHCGLCISTCVLFMQPPVLFLYGEATSSSSI